MYNAETEKRANIIGERIREAREQKKLTQTQLSTLLQQFGIQVTKATVGKWELGRYLPNAYQFLAVCHALEIADIGQYFTSLPQELNAVGLQKLAEYRSDLIATGRYGTKRRPAGVRMIEMPVSYQAVSAGTGEFLDEGTCPTVPTRVSAFTETVWNRTIMRIKLYGFIGVNRCVRVKSEFLPMTATGM